MNKACLDHEDFVTEIRWAIETKKSILVTGPAGSGKTRLLVNIRGELERQGIDVEYQDCMTVSSFCLRSFPGYTIIDHAAGPASIVFENRNVVMAVQDAALISRHIDLGGWGLLVSLAKGHTMTQRGPGLAKKRVRR
jgi:ABC-type proline/glycine betaine transport system ATPase subunit